MRRHWVWTAVVTAVLGAAALVVGSLTVRHGTRQGLRRVARRARYESGRLEGVRYRVSGRHPDPDVYSTVLADRVRSVLGPLEHRLDVPRVHVMVESHTVVLHGEVDDASQAAAIEEAVRRIPGVTGVHSHLAVGLTAGDTRPSEGADPHGVRGVRGVRGVHRLHQLAR